MSDKRTSLRRCLALVKRLEGLRYAPPLDVLAQEFHVSTRTLRRDLDCLETTGFQVPKWRLNEKAYE